MSWLDVTKDTEFACLIAGHMEYAQAFSLYQKHYEGNLFGIKTRTLDHLVTPGHRVWCRKYRGNSSIARCGLAPWGFELASEAHCKPREFLIAHDPYLGIARESYRLPAVEGARTTYEFEIGDWAELVGWFVAEGGIDAYAMKTTFKYRVSISQNREANPGKTERIGALLSKMNIAHSYHGHNFTFISKQIGHWLVANTGVGSHKIRLPQECFTWPVEARRRMLDALVLGDGSYKSNGSAVYGSVNRVLVEDVARLAITLGIPSSWRAPDTRRSPETISETTGRRRPAKCNDQYACGLLISATQGVTSERMYATAYYKQPYSGMVYCAEVPGGLLFVRRNNSVGMWSGNSRAVHPSQMGYVDLLRTPESLKAGVDTRISNSAMKGPDGKIYTPFLDARTGATVYKTPADLTSLVVAFPDELAKARARGDDMVTAMVKGRTVMVPIDKVDLSLPHMENAFSPVTNMVPLKSAAKGQRVSMGSRFILQSLAVKDPDAPLVRGRVPGTERSWEEDAGTHAGAIRSKQGGRVLEVTPESIKVQYDDGTKEEHDLYDNFVFNRKSLLHNTPTVQPGERFGPGHLLAKSNYTDGSGHVALGKNLRVAYIARGGETYEDAFSISESAAKKLTSEHAYQNTLDWDPGHRRGKKNFVSIFPAKFDRKTLESMDSDGLVKPGTVVKPGDPLVLAAKEREFSHRQVHSAHKGSFTDASLVWDHHSDGVVTDVSKTDKGVNVVVKSYNPMNIGDKISGKFGDKGIVSCFDDQTDVFTRRGWVRFADLRDDDTVAVWNGGSPSFAAPTRRIAQPYAGEMLGCEHDRLDYLVTPNHRMWCRIEHYRGKTAQFAFRSAEEAHGKKLVHRCAAPFALQKSPDFYEIPVGERTTGKRAKTVFESTAFYSFMGWHLAEGSTSFYVGKAIGRSRVKVSSWKIQLSQSRRANPAKCAMIEAVLDQLGVGWHYSGCQYVISNKPLYLYLSTLGKCDEKYVPRDLIENGDHERLSALLDALLLGDGHVTGAESRELTTTSARLAADAQEIALLLGKQSIIRIPPKIGRYKQQYLVTVSDRAEVGTGAAVGGGNAYYRTSYDGVVYCLEVPGNLLLVRRNGKPFWCGNCIIPDDQMPHDEQGRPFDVLANPLGVISRTNPSQVLEAVLGKIAEKRGSPYLVEDFDHRIDDMTQWVADEAKKHGVSDLETVTDPVTGRTIPNVLTGVRHYLKLHHQAESKGSGRGLGAVTAEGTPARGGPTGAKKVAIMDAHALLSYGALDVLKDAKLIRGANNPEYWSTLMAGYKPATPGVPQMYEKFVASLKGAGVNVVREGNTTHIMELTDKNIADMAGDRELENIETVNWQDGLKPVKGGLFDQTLTGGHGGTRWAKISLPEPMLNPVMEEPARRMLGLTQAKMEDVIAGREELNGLRGPEAISRALKNIDVDKELARARADIVSGRKSLRDNAVRKLKYLKAAQAKGIHPGEWVISAVPVLPPLYRPVSVMQGSGGQLISDANYLYKELYDARDVLKNLTGRVDDVSAERLNVYNAMKAVVGLGDPIQPKNQERKVRGLLNQIFGTSPKHSVVQSKLLGSAVNLVGRGVIAPSADLNMDQVAIPETQAWEVYSPFIVRNMVRRGVGRSQALQYLKDRHETARKSLIEEMESRPVILTRAPVLHRFGNVALWPRLTAGDTIQINPFIVGGLGADFDGDASNFHVNGSDEAAREAAEKMLPSKNLLAVSDMRSPMFAPRQEYQGGLYDLTSGENKDKRPTTP
jgi:hypothetical protein